MLPIYLFFIPFFVPNCFRNALDQAMSNTFVRDGFDVQVTKNQKASMRFLARITNLLKKMYLSKSLKCITDRTRIQGEYLLSFQNYYENSRANKPLNARQTFMNMLIQLKGLSSSMAWAIAEKYPTVKSLMNAYENCHFEKEKLLAGIPYDHGTKKIPLTVSQTVCDLFNEKDLN